MSLRTHSLIYYGLTITEDNYQLDFTDGMDDYVAEIGLGAYSLEQLADEVASALNALGSPIAFTTSVDRATRKITIAGDGAFILLITSGAHFGTSIFNTLGFSGADTTLTTSHQGGQGAGSAYATQFICQSHVSSDDEQAAAYGTINKSASGKIEVVSFGTEEFTEFELKYITDVSMPSGGPIRTNASGVDNLRSLMQYLITKGPIEFMEDEDDSGAFETLILESTPDDSKGLKYKLKEMYGIGLPGFFETGVLKFRVTQ